MGHFRTTPLALTGALALAACTGSTGTPSQPESSAPKEATTSAAPASAAATSSSNSPHELTVEGRIEQGVECPVLHTPDGEIYALGTIGDHRQGDYVSVTGELADASFCQQGTGTIDPTLIQTRNPPARDRDPARAGGIAVTSEYVQGSWVAKGLHADCDKPDFTITENRAGGSIIRTSLDGGKATGYVAVGDNPALHWDEGIPTLPIETRGPDGLAVMPAKGERMVSLGNARIEGDGVVFVKCGD